MDSRSALLRNRVAGVSDAESPEFVAAFRELEAFSNVYVTEVIAKDLFPADYPWPVDCLHNWSRWWEYTFAWLHIRQLLGEGKGPVRILDIGSALTFFPLFLARQGAHVRSIDLNAKLIEFSAGVLKQLDCLDAGAKSRFEYVHADCASTPFEADSFDAVTNISVLEHVERPKEAVDELRRVLKPGGVMVNTLDLSLDGFEWGGSMPLRPGETVALLDTLQRGFNGSLDFAFTHPQDVLAYSNRPRQLTRAISEGKSSLSYFQYRWRQIPKLLRSRIFIKPVIGAPYRAARFVLSPKRLDMWTVMGVVLKK